MAGPRRAFTLLEVTLAVLIGAMVLTTALGVFAGLQRASRQNEARMRSTMQMSMAHRAVELSLRSMILSNQGTPPQLGGPTLPGNAPAPQAETPAEPEEFQRPRVILSADASLPRMRVLDGQGRAMEMEAQRLELTLERPPVFAEPRAGETYQPVVRRMYATRQRDLDRRRAEREADDEPGRGDNESNPFDDTEPPIAPGVRGAFGLTWEPDEPRPGVVPNPDGGSWSLWYRTLPPLAPVEGQVGVEGLTDEEIDRNPMYRAVLLASDLRWCRWEAVRAGETLSEFTSTWWEDLPAYVTLEIQTVSGKWSKWMFEVAGTRGGEPGEEIERENGSNAATEMNVQRDFRPNQVPGPGSVTPAPRSGSRSGAGRSK